MSVTLSPRMERIELRTNGDVKKVIKQAAQVRKMSLSAYLLESAVIRARSDVEAADSMSLKNADWAVFYAALDAPKKPNAALKALFL